MDQHRAQAAMIGSSIKYLDINKSAREIKNSGSKAPSAHFEKLEEEFPILIPLRFPITNISALLEPDYDNTINTLVDKNITTPVITQIVLPLATNRCVAANKFQFKFFLIAGYFLLIFFPSYMRHCDNLFKNSGSKEDKTKYSLTSSVAACMFKKLQISDSFGNIIATMPSIILSLMDRYTMNMEIITESGLSYMVMADAAQVFVTCNIVDNIAKHFPLIVLPSYMRQCAAAAAAARRTRPAPPPLLTSSWPPRLWWSTRTSRLWWRRASSKP